MNVRSPRALSLVVMLGCAALLLGCAKEKEPPPPAPGSPSSSSEPSAKPAGWTAPPVSAQKAAQPPSSDGWRETKVAKAKLTLRVPEGATVEQDRAGHDDAFAGSFFRVKMPSGYDLYFAEHHGSEQVDVAAEKRRYQLDRDKAVLVYDAPDALVVNRTEPPPAGQYCEVTACGRLGDRPICASHAGAIIDGQEVKKLTADECLAVIAIARSIRAL